MLVNLYRYIRGYLVVKTSGFSLERFINLCCKNNIRIWKLNSYDYEFHFCICLRDFYKLKPYLRKTKTHIRILDKKGLPFFFYKYRKRKIFFAGFFLFTCIIFVLTQFIWEIDFEGNLSITEDILMKFLTEQNIHSGALKKEVDSSSIEKLIRNKYNNVIWASVEIKGTRMIVHIKENDNIKEENSNEVLGSIIADKDGIITGIITRQGTPQVKKGDEIKKDTLLVDGKVPVYNDAKEIIKYNYCIADADIYAQTVYEYHDEIPISYNIKRFTGNNSDYIYFRLFDKEIVFKLFNQNYDYFDSIYSEQQLIIGKNIYLPFYFGTRSDNEYIVETQKYTNDEVLKIANEKLEAFCENLIENGVQILDKNVNIEVSGNACISDGYIIVNEKIGCRTRTDLVETDNLAEKEDE